MTPGKTNTWVTEMEEYWARQHETQNVEMLADYSFKQIQNYLDLIDYTKNGIRILDIGIGTGKETIQMAKLGMEVYGLDITMKAYWTVMDVVKDFWLFEDIEQLPMDTFDLAICHLVAQHNTDENLKRLMTYTIKSLKRDAVFAIQYATRLNKNHRTDDSLESQKAGTVCRTQGEMRKLVFQCKGIIIHECKTVDYPEAGMSWNGLHITRHL